MKSAILFLILLAASPTSAQAAALVGRASADDVAFYETGRSTDCKEQLRIAALRSDSGIMAQYEPYLEGIYDQLPAGLQKAFCQVVKLDIRDIPYSAQTSAKYSDSGSFAGAEVTFNPDFVAIDPSTWATWKEQLSFLKRKTKDYANPRPGLPRIREAIPTTAHPWLYQSLLHELTHVLDYASGWNAFCASSLDCEPGPWTGLSWKVSAMKVEAKADLPFLSSLCFYNCDSEEVIPASDELDRMYGSFALSDFPTLYGATNPFDDLAESSKLYWLSRIPGAVEEVLLPSGKTLDLVSRFANEPQFEAKRRFIAEHIPAN